MYLEINPLTGIASLIKRAEEVVGTISFDNYIITETKHEEGDILDLIFYSDDLHCRITVRDFLKKLLTKLWEEEDGFTGKRPFGNSCWKDDIFTEMCKRKIIDGEIEYFEDGSILSIDWDGKKGNEILLDAIKRLK